MSDIQRIARNTSISGVSNIITALLGFTLSIYVARYLGEIEFGKYSFALSVTGIIIIFADIGISSFLIREIARNMGSIEDYLFNIVTIKLALAFLTLLFIYACMSFVNPLLFNIIFLFTIYSILLSFMQVNISIFTALEKYENIAMVLILEKLILIFLFAFISAKGYGLIELAYIYIFSEMIIVIISSFMTLKISKINLYLDFELCKTIVISSLPFGLNAIFSLLFFKIDTVMLSIFKNDWAVGIYNAAYNPILAISIVISSIIISLIYPMMSKYFISSRESLEALTILSAKYMAIIGFPMAMGIFLLADKFISILYVDQYTSSTMAFRILSLFIPIRLISSVIGTLLTSIDKQNIRMFSVGISAIFNIILNLLLIPYLSYVGASIATILSELFLYWIFTYSINRYYKPMNLSHLFFKPIISSLLMGAVLIYLINYNIIFVILICSIIYFIVLASLGTFSKDDKYLIYYIAKRMIGWTK